MSLALCLVGAWPLLTTQVYPAFLQDGCLGQPSWTLFLMSCERPLSNYELNMQLTYKQEQPKWLFIQ